MHGDLPDLSTPPWTGQLAALLERAATAVARLDARISATSLSPLWRERAAPSGFAAARQAQGAELDEIDVFSLRHGLLLPGRRRPAFAADERAELIRWQEQLARRPVPHWRDLTGLHLLALPPDWSERPALLRALELTARMARDRRTDEPWLASPILFATLRVTRAPLPCLVVADKALRLTPRDRAAIVPRYLKTLVRQAESGLERLDAMSAYRRRTAELVGASRRPGSLPALAALLQRQPGLSPLTVARVLKLSKSGAGKLLARAAEAGLAVEVTGRQAWKTYLPWDAALALGLVTRPAGRPRAIAAPSELDPVLARFDEEMAAVDARLRALGLAPAPLIADALDDETDD